MCTALTLNNQRDYVVADNSEVIATDSQKNIVHVLAKQNRVSCEGGRVVSLVTGRRI